MRRALVCEAFVGWFCFFLVAVQLPLSFHSFKSFRLRVQLLVTILFHYLLFGGGVTN